MEIDNDKFKQFAVQITRVLKELETEVLALRTTLYSLKATFDIDGDPEMLVNAAKNGASVQTAMNQKYDPPLAEFLERVHKQEATADAFLDSLRQWRPTDRVN
jgi:hypothetical protein